MSKSNTLFTVLISFAFAACAAQPVGGESGDPDMTNNDPNDPNDPSDPNDPNDPNNPGGGATASQVIELISRTECDQAHTCKANFPTDFGVTFAQAFGNSPAECYPLNDEYWNAAAVEAAIAGGTITFDQAAADACMAGAVSAPVCTTFWDEGPGIDDACWATFTGTVQAGGACQIDFECAGETYCGEAGTCTADTGQ